MRRHWGIAAIGLGVMLLIGSIGFRTLAAPALVRFPLNVDETATYTGTALTYVDQATLLPLTKPKREALQIDRRVKVVSGTFRKAVIDETVTVKTGATTTVETYQYVIDRRSMKMVSDPRQIAFGDPKAIMHATGAFRVNFAMGTNAHTSYLAFIPEEDAVSRLVLVEGPHSHPDAHIKVLDFSSKLNGPVAPYYLAHLKQMGLPMEVTAAQLAPVLLADGIDVDRALADVGPRLTPAQSRLVAATLARPIPLHYFFLSDGLISIEPKTGALIDVHTHQQGIAVQPDLSGASALQPLLNEYAGIPSVRALSEGLAALSKRAPQVAESFTYTQTVPSSLAVTRIARDHVRMMNLGEFRVPGAMMVPGLLLLGLGLISLVRGRHGHKREGVSVPPPGPTTIPTEPATADPVATLAAVGRNPEGK
jgi:hypothetical protein